MAKRTAAVTAAVGSAGVSGSVAGIGTEAGASSAPASAAPVTEATTESGTAPAPVTGAAADPALSSEAPASEGAPADAVGTAAEPATVSEAPASVAAAPAPDAAGVSGSVAGIGTEAVPKFPCTVNIDNKSTMPLMFPDVRAFVPAETKLPVTVYSADQLERLKTDAAHLAYRHGAGAVAITIPE